MFVNQVNIKDLFSTNSSLIGRRDQASDSAFDSSQGNSQFMFSQVDLSESQDLMSGPSQTPAETKISPGKKFYQRYISKGLLFPKDSQSLDSRNKFSFKEQLAMNKAAAKERDDREIISSIFSVIKESTYELKEAISVVQENLKQSSSSRLDLKNHIAKVEENLSRHTVKFLDNLTTRDHMRDEIIQLKLQLVQKETEITKMTEQLKDAKTNQLKGLKDQLHKMHEEHKSWSMQHLDNLTFQQKQLHEDSNAKQQKFSEQQHKTLKNVETILQKHVDGYAKQHKSDQYKYHQWFNDLKESQEHHTAHLKDSLASNVVQIQDIQQSQKNDLGSLIHQQDLLRKLYQQHRCDMEKYLKQQLQITREGNEEIKELVDHICRETLPSAIETGKASRREAGTQEATFKEDRSSRSLQKDTNEDSAHNYGESLNIYPRAQKVDINFTERTAHAKDGFCSPLTPFVKTWNSKSLFSKRHLDHADLTGATVSKGLKEKQLQENVPSLNTYFGKQTRGMKRCQDALMDTSDSSVNNRGDTIKPNRPSVVKRNQSQSDAQLAKKTTYEVLSPGVKAEPVSPDERWMRALSAKARPGALQHTGSLEPVHQIDVDDLDSQLSSPSLSVSQFFFSSRKDESVHHISKTAATKTMKRRKKSRFSTKKKGGRK